MNSSLDFYRSCSPSPIDSVTISVLETFPSAVPAKKIVSGFKWALQQKAFGEEYDILRKQMSKLFSEGLVREMEVSNGKVK